MPVVLNKYRMLPGETGVLIDRSTPYGNPFPVTEEKPRGVACDEYIAWIYKPEQLGLRAKMRRDLRGKNVICTCKQPGKEVRCHGDTVIEVANKDFTWQRHGGYECSSKGDKRFSAIWAIMPDRRSLESHYQCDKKNVQPWWY